MVATNVSDDTISPYEQKLRWNSLRKSFNGIINKVMTMEYITDIVPARIVFSKLDPRERSLLQIPYELTDDLS
jgi:hypothetical protein